MATVTRMDGGELQMIREYLGLTGDELAGLLAVNPRTVRAWEAGRDSIPERVRGEVAVLERVTDTAVARVVESLQDNPHVMVWRETAELHAALPADWHLHMSARWWRHVVARACQQVPGVQVVTGGGE